MKNNSILRFWLLNVVLVLFSFNGFGQILIPNTTPLTENFDAMAASGTASLPSNWKMSPAGAAAPTWAAAGNFTAVNQQASSGAPATGARYNWGTSATERALGVMTSGGYASPNSIMAFYQNSNASAITDITISYDLERYRINTAAASVQFYYSLDGSTWTAVAAGNIAAASLPTGASAYNFTPGLTINVAAFTITGLSITNGSNIYLRWNLNTTGGNSQGIGIDNVSVTAAFGVASPTITASPSSLSSFTYVVGSGPSSVQSFTTSGSNLTNNIVLNAPTNFEIATASGGPFSSTLTLTHTSGTVASTPIFTRLISALGVNTYTGTIDLTSTGATSLTVTLNGSVTGSAASDIVSAGGESATISSLINTAGPLTSVQGTQVWQFTIRDGGAGLNDGDNLPSVLTALTFSQAAGDAIGDWSTSIQAIDLFDGATNVGSGTVTVNQVQFTGLNISVADNTQKTISVRLTLKCPLGSGALDGDDFGFQISNGNATFSITGSGKTAFAAVSSTNAQNAIAIVATTLTFIQQPSNAPNSGVMSPAVVVSATDACGNVDRDFTSTIDITSTGTLSASPVSVVAINGSSTFSSLIHTVNATGLTLTATSGAFSTVSSTFDITNVTIFGAGDIAIVGMCVNMGACGGAAGEDEISFVTFEDIAPGTSIDLTDNGFQRVGCGSNTWGDGEGVVRITRTTSTLPKGAVITLRLMNNSVFVPLQPDANWTVSYPVGTSFNLNGTDEQVYIMQGGIWNNPGGASDATYTGGTLMFAINTFNAWTCNDNTTTRGDLPLPLKCFSILPGIATANIKYTGPVTPASQKDWVDRLNSVTNWSGTATCAAYVAGGLDYGGTAQYYSIIASGFNQGQWTGASNTDWFDCNNWQNFKIPDVVTDVVIDQTALRSCEVGVSTLTTAAVCQSINVNSNDAVTRNLSVINSASLTVGQDVAITKTTTSANLSLSVLNTSTFTCNNLTLTGTGSGIEDAQFNNKQNTTTVNINGNLTLNTGAKLDLTDVGNYGIVNLSGSYFNNGLESDFKQTNSIVKFNGTSVQSITTNGFNEVFGNIIVNKASGTLNLYNNVEVENVVTFTSGLVNSTASALLIFRDAASHASASNASFTNGPVRKIGNDSFTFPIGKTSVYAPAGITAPSVVSDHFTAEYFDSNPHPTYDNTLKDITIDHLSICEHWIINRTNGTSNVSVDLSWNTPRSCGVTTLADLLVARWDGTMWKDHGNGGTTGNTTTGTIVTLGAVTAFSPFTLGSVTVLNPLPIVVNNFEALKNGNNVDLSWSVSNNNKISYFEIWTSTNAENFVLLETVKASNKHLTSKDYSTIDNSPEIGVNYYKLKVVDVNGRITFSEIKSVSFDLNNSIYIFPNPVELGKDVYVNLQLIDENEIVEVSIVDQIGKIILNNSYKGQKSIYFNTANLAKGVYFVKVKSKNELVSQRIIVI